MNYFESLYKTPLEKEAFLFFADISGYTQYVKIHSRTWSHGQFIISELLNAVIEELNEPLKIAKLEGDAIFFYLLQDININTEFIKKKLMLLFESFKQKKQNLHSVTMCSCPCCSSIQTLKLKLIVHSGKILTYDIKGYQEVSGLDVITLHRLSKNKVNQKEYLLLTEQAFSKILFEGEITFVTGKEKYDEIGEIKTYVHFPNSEGELQEKKTISFIFKFIFEVKMIFITFIIRIKSYFKKKR
ncbi:DUF2652 domain-containing protein [Silvanigrella aquatica]|uniref:Guanylate cyclase domain-containing protein n=1 Tax=Silvanigrella aquatica TaxID=1915309 RepID=A0A1L4D0C7_9BACT|nr:DUF2652 domain-containing protein [Silvanigrella aquatica]APJ03649.1 hypothetical protein AXG55_06905 [Silvanigrella aquatica]